MGHYTKLGVLLIRAFGVLIVVYGVLMLGIAVIGQVAGWNESSQSSSSGGTLFWLVAYLIAGLFLLVLARPLGAMIGGSLDAEEPSGGTPPAV